LEYELAAIQVIGEVNDTHANLWGGKDKVEELRGWMYAPFKAQFIGNKLVVTDYFNPELKDSAGLEIGDIITHINGKRIEYLVDSLRKYYRHQTKPPGCGIYRPIYCGHQIHRLT
jgi:S1-C subfamily serine protease